MVERVCYIERAALPEGKPRVTVQVQLGPSRLSAVTGKAPPAVARHDLEHPRGQQAEDLVPARIDDIEVPVGCYREPLGVPGLNARVASSRCRRKAYAARLLDSRPRWTRTGDGRHGKLWHGERDECGRTKARGWGHAPFNFWPSCAGSLPRAVKREEVIDVQPHIKPVDKAATYPRAVRHRAAGTHMPAPLIEPVKLPGPGGPGLGRSHGRRRPRSSDLTGGRAPPGHPGTAPSVGELGALGPLPLTLTPLMTSRTTRLCSRCRGRS